MNRYDISLQRQERVPLNSILKRINKNSIVLEFGPANGRMTEVLQKEYHCDVYIVEYDEELYSKAMKFAKAGICSDIMKYEWMEKFAGIKFDYIIFADVLEHLPNPEEVLGKAKGLLKEAGSFLISVPNLAHNDVLIGLLDEKFSYHTTGLLDETHIHFFTYQSAIDMFSKLGLSVVYNEGITKSTLSTELIPDISQLNDDLALSILRRPFGTVYQMVFELTPKDLFSIADRENTIYVERRVYFDYGKGYDLDNCISLEASIDDQMFSVEFEVPSDLICIRFDPALYVPCIISDFDIVTNVGNISISSENGQKSGKNGLVFNRIDGQIFITELEGVNWMSLHGKISYDFSLMFKNAYEVKYNYISGLNETTIKELGIAKEELGIAKEELGATKEELGATKEELGATKEELDMVQSIIVGKDEEICHMKNRCDELQKQNVNLSNEIEHIKSTKSWIYTKFLRKVFQKRNRKIEQSVSETNTVQHIEEVCPQCCESVNIPNCEDISNEDISIWKGEIAVEEDTTPLVSIIVPNYNHGKYLKERLDTIYAQTYSNYEVILLDDNSTDNSRDILLEYAEKYKEKTKYSFNEKNCGKVFKQWNKGISMASGKYIWIAESDDYSEPNFLETMVPLLKYESVMLAFARSIFMQDGQQIWTTEEYLADIPEMKWNEPFTMTAKQIVEKAFSIKNIIPNVSSCIFRNVGLLPEAIQNIWGEMLLSGDWIFYLHQIKGGCVSYTNATNNYYRVHAASTSLKIQKTSDYYREYEKVSMYLAENYIVPRHNFEIVLDILEHHYMAIQKVGDASVVKEYYDIDKIMMCSNKRKPNVLMACFSICSGGGETYPLYLANEMKQQGVAVTVLDFRYAGYSKEVRKILHPSVPLVEVESFDFFKDIVTQLGGEVIHSHHALIDEAIAIWITGHSIDCKHYVTLHGMYETLELSEQKRVIDVVDKSCQKYIYIADKNLQPFIETNHYTEGNFVKLPNGLPISEINEIDKEDIGIPKEDFLVCIASRGIPEKGWREAIEAISIANTCASKHISLMILGDGPIKAELENDSPSFVHFVGEKRNVRDYISISDIVLVPTRFKGESFPLIIIEALQCGKPVIATDIAEVKNELTTSDGELAGLLLHLNDWQLDIQEIADKILEICNDEKLLDSLSEKVKDASLKFDISRIVEQYLDVYAD